MKDLIAIIQKIEKAMAVQLPTLQREVDAIITDKITDISIIERTLDLLLDYGQLGIGEEEFRRLNGYYATVHPEYAQEYTKFYAEREK